MAQVPWGEVIAIGSSILGGAIGSAGAGDAAKNARRLATASYRSQVAAAEQARADMYPWISAGTAALNEQRKQLGLPPMQESEKPFVASLESLKPLPTEYYGSKKSAKKGGGYYDPRTGQVYRMVSEGPGRGQFQKEARVIEALKAPATNVQPGGPGGMVPGAQPVGGGRYGAFESSPGYLFAYDEAMRAVNSGNSAKGRAYSGANMRELTRYAAGMASQDYDKYYNRLAGLSNTGANTAGNAGSINVNASANQGNALYNAGMARASGIANQANIWGQAIADIGGTLGDWWTRSQEKKKGTA